MQVVLVQLEGLPPAEARRALAEVHDHIDDRAAGAAHKLGRPGPDLKVHAPHDPAARARVVVLHELIRYPKLRVQVVPVALMKEPALVAEDPRSDEDRTLQPGLEPFHVNTPLDCASEAETLAKAGPANARSDQFRPSAVIDSSG
jgi:hypothetical protein